MVEIRQRRRGALSSKCEQSHYDTLRCYEHSLLEAKMMMKSIGLMPTRHMTTDECYRLIQWRVSSMGPEQQDAVDKVISEVIY